MASNTRATIYGDFAADFVETACRISAILNGGIQTGPFGSQLHQEDYVAVGTPIITVEHLGENRILHEGVPRVSDEDKDRLLQVCARGREISYLARVGSVDRRALVREDRRRVALFRSLPSSLLGQTPARSTPAIFRTSSACHLSKQHIRAIAVGATMPSLNTQLLSDVIASLSSSSWTNNAPSPTSWAPWTTRSSLTAT